MRKLIQSVSSPFSARFRKSSAKALLAVMIDPPGYAGKPLLSFVQTKCSNGYSLAAAVSLCSLRILSLPGALVECHKSRFKQNPKQIAACGSTSAEKVPLDQWSRHRTHPYTQTLELNNQCIPPWLRHSAVGLSSWSLKPPEFKFVPRLTAFLFFYSAFKVFDCCQFWSSCPLEIMYALITNFVILMISCFMYL